MYLKYLISQEYIQTMSVFFFHYEIRHLSKKHRFSPSLFIYFIYLYVHIFVYFIQSLSRVIMESHACKQCFFLVFKACKSM